MWISMGTLCIRDKAKSCKIIGQWRIWTIFQEIQPINISRETYLITLFMKLCQNTL